MTALIKFPLRANKSPGVDKGVSWKTYTGAVTTSIYGIAVPDGVFIIDIDLYKGIALTDVNALLDCTPDWEAAALQSTLNGGVHYAFQCTELLRQGQDIGMTGFDTRSAGHGYIATGTGYTDMTVMGLEWTLLNPSVLPVLPQEAIDFLIESHKKPTGADGSPVQHGNFESFLAAQPVGVDLDAMELALSRLPDEAADNQDTWLRVGMALWHETEGGDDGWQLFDEFSQRSPKYDERANRVRWDSFNNNGHKNPVTFASVIKMVNDANPRPPAIEPLPQETVDELVMRARAVTTHEQYQVLKAELVTNTEIPIDVRAMLAKSIYDSFGKAAGINIAIIRAEIAPARGELVLASEGGVFKDWVFIEALNRYYDLRRNVAITAQGFRVNFDGHEQVTASGMDAVTYASHTKIKIAHDLMFWPGASQVFTHRGLNMVNNYVPHVLDIPEVLNAEQLRTVDSFERHLQLLLPNESDRVIIKDWMAFVVQNPGNRVAWAVLIKGTEGDGKSYLAYVLDMVIGSVKQVAGASIGGQFNGWAHGARVVAVEEVRVSGDKKFESLDRMKPLISNDTVAIEEKGRDIRTVPNFSSYMLFTNHADALPIGASDRRYCVLETPFNNKNQLFKALGGEDEAAAYYGELFDLLRAHPEALAHHLTKHVISASFKPKSHAPTTTAKMKMLEATVSNTQEMIELALEVHASPFIGPDLIDVTQLNNLCNPFMGQSNTPLPKTRALANTLRDMGYVQIEGRRVRVGKSSSYIWYNPDAHTSDSAIAAVRGW